MLASPAAVAALRLVVCCAVVFASDGLFVGAIMRDSYVAMVERVQREPLRLRAGPAALASFAVALGVFLVALADGAPWRAEDQLRAAAFGACAFAIYNATNLAVFTQWSRRNAAIDTAYGTALCAGAYALASLITRREERHE